MAAHHQGDIFPFNNLSGPENQVTDDGHSHLECSRLLSLGSGNFPDIVSSFGLSSLTDNNVYYPNYPKHEGCHIEKCSASARSGSMGPIGGTKVADHEEINQDNKITSDNGKKLRMPDYHFDKFQGTATEKLKDVSDSSSEGLEERDKKKHKIEQGPDVNPKEDYIHVRARRGQATNSHSLAERVRRGKISERMKFLQDIVPGCNKITGKAVMLDEIINYVQSLQRQVEFLSMKLATVNPELNFDIERIHSKDILNSRGGSLDFLRLATGIGSPPHFLQSQQGNMHEKMVIQSLDNSGEVLKVTNSQFSTITQISGVWDDELQKIVQQTGFSPNAPPNNAELHGRMKPEL